MGAHARRNPVQRDFNISAMFCVFIPQATSSGSQPKKLPVEEQSYVVMVTDTAKRSLLTKEILDFCGVLPIYNTKLYPDTSTRTGVAGNELKKIMKIPAFYLT